MVGFVSLSLVLGLIFSILFSRFLANPREKKLIDENGKYHRQLSIINNHVKKLNNQLAEIQEKDKKIYRVIYEADPFIETENKGTGDSYTDLENMSDKDLIISIKKNIQQLTFSFTQQEKSFQELMTLAKNQNKMLSSIPAIQPVSNKNLDRLASGYGYRIDPIYHTTKFHAGMDFTAPIGTEIYSTGDGIVKEIRSDEWGYGNHIIIDHGYGYSTLYGHVSRYNVKSGQKVTRGQLIAFIGSTGKSTGPHLHYEVRKNGQALNPAFFYYNDLSDADYEKMLKLSSRTTKSFD